MAQTKGKGKGGKGGKEERRKRKRRKRRKRKEKREGNADNRAKLSDRVKAAFDRSGSIVRGRDQMMKKEGSHL